MRGLPLSVGYCSQWWGVAGDHALGGGGGVVLLTAFQVWNPPKSTALTASAVRAPFRWWELLLEILC